MGNLLPSDIDKSFLDVEEGYSNKFIYPGGNSGPTIGRGIDIGNLDAATTTMLFEGVDQTTMSRIKTGYGLKRDQAKKWVNSNKDIVIQKTIIEKANESILSKFWDKVTTRYVGISAAPSSVKTAVLSCCYNRGYANKELIPFIGLISTKNWKGIADLLWNMQQDHELRGIRKRRRREASLIYKELKVQVPRV